MPLVGRSRAVRTGGVLLAGLAADGATKLWAANALDGGRTIELVGPLRLQLSHNTGIAFSIGTGRSPVFVVVGLVVTALLVWMASQATTALQSIGFGFILAGALGNLVDRMLGGSVIDFIDPQFWPVFNVADICLFLGAGLLVIGSLAPDHTADQAAADRIAQPEDPGAGDA